MGNRRFFSTIIAIALSGATPSCNRSGATQGAPSGSASAGDPSESPRKRESFDLLAHLDTCELRHRGVLFDLGTRAAKMRRSFRIEPLEGIVDAEREGATVSRISVPKVSYEVVVDEPIEDATFSIRVFGGNARMLSIAVDDRRIGAVKPVPGELKSFEIALPKGTLAAGRHTVTLTTTGRPRASTEAGVEVDWFRIGPTEEAQASYVAPTQRDLVINAALEGAPRRALGLRAPASVRCPILPGKDSEVQVDVGFWGAGKGSLDVRIVGDGEPPVVLAERRVVGGPGSTWAPLNLPLRDHAGKLVSLELRALESSKGGRILFGDPKLARSSEGSGKPPEASVAVVVIASALDRKTIPPWGPTQGLTTLGELARASSTFSTYRVPSNVAGASVGSVLTGLAPGVHGLEDPAARLPSQARTLGALVKEASGRTAMFSGSPTTFRAFGFDTGWDRYETFSPVNDIEAVAPIARATKWFDDEEFGENDGKRRLVVIHARGGHPPWDVTKDEAAHLPPDEYSGLIDPRRGGVVLGRLRSQRGKAHKKIGDDDWARLRSLVLTALTKQDVALGQLIGVLKKKGVWDSTLFIVVGDVSPGDPPEVPFDPAGPLGEDRLIAPLLVKFPGGKLAGKEIGTPVTSVDVAPTILTLLGLQIPPDLQGADLYRIADGLEPLAGRGLVATLGDRYATRFGPFLLSGQIGKTPQLCQLDVDPACVNDAFAQKPIAGMAAWQATFGSFEVANKKRLAAREPASIDPDTGAALTVWGDI